LKNVYSGNLDQIQIIKGWMDASGATHEKVFDVVWAAERKPGANGKLPVFLKIDVQNKVAQSVRAGREQRTSEIPSKHEAVDSLVLLGVDQGAGWSTTIGSSDRKPTLSVSGAGIGYISFPARIPRWQRGPLRLALMHRQPIQQLGGFSMNKRVVFVGVLAAVLFAPLASQARDVAGDTVRGAAKGAVIGGIAGDAGKGAAAGAVGSALIGGVRRNRLSIA
jgi:hypothetical protein